MTKENTNIFESEFRSIFKNIGLEDIYIYDKILVGKINNLLLAKITWDTRMVADRYCGLLVEIINKETGRIDSCFFNIGKIIGIKQVSSSDKLSPYIWESGYDACWYRYTPTTAERKKICTVIKEYIDMYR